MSLTERLENLARLRGELKGFKKLQPHECDALGFPFWLLKPIGYKTYSPVYLYNIAFILSDDGVWSFIDTSKKREYDEYMEELDDILDKFKRVRNKIAKKDLHYILHKIVPSDLVNIILSYHKTTPKKYYNMKWALVRITLKSDIIHDKAPEDIRRDYSSLINSRRTY